MRAVERREEEPGNWIQEEPGNRPEADLAHQASDNPRRFPRGRAYSRDVARRNKVCAKHLGITRVRDGFRVACR